MSLQQFFVMAVVDLLVTVPLVLLIPRARSSPVFDRLLWGATIVVGFLVVWVAVAMAKSASILDGLVVGETAALPAVIGALGGVLALNLPLWLVDRFGGSAGEETAAEEVSDSQTAAAEERPQDRS